jgi:hypothetical protein
MGFFFQKVKSTSRHLVRLSGLAVLRSLREVVQASWAAMDRYADPAPIEAVRKLDRQIGDLRLSLIPLNAGRFVMGRARAERSLTALLACAARARILAGLARAGASGAACQIEFPGWLPPVISALPEGPLGLRITRITVTTRHSPFGLAACGLRPRLDGDTEKLMGLKLGNTGGTSIPQYTVTNSSIAAIRWWQIFAICHVGLRGWPGQASTSPAMTALIDSVI